MPRRQQPDYSRAMPWFGLSLRIYWAKGRSKGTPKNVKGTSTAGHSHRREATPAAKPNLTWPMTFEAELGSCVKVNVYSYLSATRGSTRVARRDGR
jgi:hypothetical protein